MTWDKARSIAVTILIWGMLLLITWTVWSYATGRSTSNDDLLYELRYGNCLLAKPMPERELHAAVVECQTYAETGILP